MAARGGSSITNAIDLPVLKECLFKKFFLALGFSAKNTGS
jgi:hypothetical protein